MCPLESIPYVDQRVHSQKCSILVSPMAPHLLQNQLHFLSSSFFKKLFYWSIVYLQCCVSFCYMVKWFSYTYVYILFPVIFHYGLPQDLVSFTIGCSSLCYTTGLCCLAILYTTACLYTEQCLCYM